jgi:hypothetical protein
MRGGTLKAVIGRPSTAVLTAAEIDIPMDFDGVAKAGSCSAGRHDRGGRLDVHVDDEEPQLLCKHESCGARRAARARADLRLLRDRGGRGRRPLTSSSGATSGSKTVCSATARSPRSRRPKFRAEFGYHVREALLEVGRATFEQASRRAARRWA